MKSFEEDLKMDFEKRFDYEDLPKNVVKKFPSLKGKLFDRKRFCNVARGKDEPLDCVIISDKEGDCIWMVPKGMNEELIGHWAFVGTDDLINNCVDKQRLRKAFKSCATIWDYEKAKKELGL